LSAVQQSIEPNARFSVDCHQQLLLSATLMLSEARTHAMFADISPTREIRTFHQPPPPPEGRRPTTSVLKNG